MINYVIGDATEPQVEDGNRLIMHICNNLGAWGGGFVLAVSDKWSAPEDVYRQFHAQGGAELGDVHIVKVDEKTYVANMVAQDGFPTSEKPVAVDYGVLRDCLQSLAEMPEDFTFHAPRIGCGIGGGSWDEVSKIIDEELGNFETYIYDLEPRSEYASR